MGLSLANGLRMNLEQLQFKPYSDPKAIATAVKSSGIAIVPNFILPAALELVLEQFEKARSLHEDAHVQQSLGPYQDVTYVTPSRLCETNALSSGQYLGNFAALDPFPQLQGLVNSPFLARIASSFYADNDYIQGTRIQIINTIDSPPKLKETPYYLHHDKIHFFIFFIYLNDVTTKNGPMEIVLDPELKQRAAYRRREQMDAGIAWNFMENKMDVTAVY